MKKSGWSDFKRCFVDNYWNLQYLKVAHEYLLLCVWFQSCNNYWGSTFLNCPLLFSIFKKKNFEFCKQDVFKSLNRVIFSTLIWLKSQIELQDVSIFCDFFAFKTEEMSLFFVQFRTAMLKNSERKVLSEPLCRYAQESNNLCITGHGSIDSHVTEKKRHHSLNYIQGRILSQKLDFFCPKSIKFWP